MVTAPRSRSAIATGWIAGAEAKAEPPAPRTSSSGSPVF